MVKITKQGFYTLIETKNHTKMLTLDGVNFYAWVFAEDIGDILVKSHKTFPISHVLCVGAYRLYSVIDEERATDLDHLELLVGNGRWQGYLLPTGLPTAKKKRNRIIPTNQIISKSKN